MQQIFGLYNCYAMAIYCFQKGTEQIYKGKKCTAAAGVEKYDRVQRPQVM